MRMRWFIILSHQVGETKDTHTERRARKPSCAVAGGALACSFEAQLPTETLAEPPVPSNNSVGVDIQGLTSFAMGSAPWLEWTVSEFNWCKNGLRQGCCFLHSIDAGGTL